MKKLQWDDSYSIGVELLDGQHKTLFNILNSLYEAVETESYNDIVFQVDALLEYIMYHFKDEENHFDVKKFSDHVEKHNVFTNQIGTLVGALIVAKTQSKSAVVTIAGEIQSKVADWILEHVLGTDKETFL